MQPVTKFLCLPKRIFPYLMVGALSIVFLKCAQAQPQPSSVLNPTPYPTSTPSPTSPRASASTSPTATTSLAVAADTYTPQVTIWINNISAPNDDLVQWQSGTTPCEIFIANPNGQDVTVVMNHPNDRIAFVGEDTAKHLTLTLDGQGAHSSFAISGQIKSTSTTVGAINVHKDNVYTPIIGANFATVYYFTPSVSVTRDGTYSMTSAYVASGATTFVYAASPSAVHMTASILANPSEVDITAPQLANLKVALVQNQKNVSYQFVSSNPYVISNNSGGPLTVPATVNTSYGFTEPHNDRTTISPILPTLGPYSVNSIVNLNDNIDVTDNPRISSSHLREIRDTNNNVVATYSYDTGRATLKGPFTDYAVLFNPNDPSTNYDIKPLRQTGWPMNLDSNVGNQYISPNSTQQAYVSGMVPDGESANQALIRTKKITDSTTTETIN